MGLESNNSRLINNYKQSFIYYKDL